MPTPFQQCHFYQEEPIEITTHPVNAPPPPPPHTPTKGPLSTGINERSRKTNKSIQCPLKTIANPFHATGIGVDFRRVAAV